MFCFNAEVQLLLLGKEPFSDIRTEVCTHLCNLFSNLLLKLLILPKKITAIQQAFFPLIELNSLFRVLNTITAYHLNHIIFWSRKAFQSLDSCSTAGHKRGGALHNLCGSVTSLNYQDNKLCLCEN